MKYPTVRTVFDRRKIATREICSTVYVELLHNRVRRYYNTGVKVYAGEWHPQKMVVNRADSYTLNQRISALVNKIQSYINMCIESDSTFEFDNLAKYLSFGENKASFTDFMETRINERELRPNTVKNHLSTLKILQEFGRIVSFADITVPKIREFDEWLHMKYKNQTSVHFRHKVLKAYINEAIRAGLVKHNPYDMVQIQRGKSNRRKFLEEWELQQIMDADMPNASLSKVRDLFVFQCYTGMAYADLAKFDFSKVVQRNGKYIVRDARQKSDEIFYLVLLSPAVEVLRRYDYRLPAITNQQYNLRLKAVADYAKIEKNLTTHMARHTFAGICINNGVKIETLAQMMGHTDIKTTQIYAKIFNKTVESAFESLEQTLSK